MRIGNALSRRGWITSMLVPLCLVLGCAAIPRNQPLEVSAGVPGTSLVVGRIQVYRGGERLHVGPRERPMFGWITGPTPLTTVGLREVYRNERFSVTIENADGWFAVHLPPGRYGIGLQYYIFLADTPATIEVPLGGQNYCVGTLNVDLAARSSGSAVWTSTFGGVVAQGDMAFGVSDECKLVPTSVPMEADLMQLGSVKETPQ
jgi:hypothetical protein